jgi:hypothetical protein
MSALGSTVLLEIRKDCRLWFRLILSVVIFILCCSFIHADEGGEIIKSPSKRLFPKPKYTISIAMIFQNDAPYLKEWIEFHRLVGVEHFFLYNNLSTDNYIDVLNPYIQSGVVELIEWPHDGKTYPEWDAIQCLAYNDALKRAKPKTKWLAVIDSDEFLVPVKNNDLISFLAPYDQPKIGGIYAYWVVFGTSFVKKVPDNQLLIETLTLNGGASQGHYKSIVRPFKVENIVSPHYAIYKKGCLSIAVDQKDLQINHYWSRDEWYLYNVKIPRRKKWDTSSDICEHWATAANNETDEGKVILRFIPQLRLLMGLSP